MKISEEDLKELLLMFPEEKRELLQKQINVIMNIINDDIVRYTESLHYREAIDKIFMLIMKGEML